MEMKSKALYIIEGRVHHLRCNEHWLSTHTHKDKDIRTYFLVGSLVMREVSANINGFESHFHHILTPIHISQYAVSSIFIKSIKS